MTNDGYETMKLCILATSISPHHSNASVTVYPMKECWVCEVGGVAGCYRALLKLRLLV